MCPGIPERLLETVLVELAHFDPIAVQVAVEGVYPAMLLSLPRVPDPLFESCLEEARSGVTATTIALLGSLTAGPEGGDAATTARPPGSVAGSAIPLPRSPSIASRAGAAPAGGKGGAGAGAVAASRSTTGAPVAASTAAKSIMAKQPLHSPELPPEKRLELAAERARLVRLIGGAEMDAMRAAEQALLQAELQRSAEEQQATDVTDAARPDQDGDAMTSTATATLRRSMSGTALAAGGLRSSSASVAGVTTAAAKARKDGPIQPALPSLAASHYVLDFGCIVKGASRTRKFKLTNVGHGAVTFKWDRALLESWGLRVEPEAVMKLPGAPEMGSLEVALTLTSGRRVLGLGPMEMTMPIPVKGAPPVLITIKADIQVC